MANLTRRTLLLGAAGATVGAAVGTTSVRPMSKAGSGRHIVVVGAGFAGIGASRALAARGDRVTVLEGQDRIGGRALTSSEMASPVDLGASWLHTGAQNPLASLARQSGVRFDVTDYQTATTYDLSAESARARPFASIYPNTDLDRRLNQTLGLPYLRWWIGRVFAAAGSGRSVGDVWRAAIVGKVDPLVEGAYRLMLETTFAAPLDDIAVESLFQNREGIANHEWFMTGGMQRFADYLATGLDIRLATRVTEIGWDAAGALVNTEAESIACDAVVLTVSIGLLKSGAIRLTPGLPQRHRDALDRMRMGLLNKVALQFPDIAWPINAHYLGIIGGAIPTVIANHASYSGQPILMAITGGDTARRVETWSDDEVVSRLLNSLERALGRRLPAPEKTLVTRWASNPWTLGSYAYSAPGANALEANLLAQPIDGRLFLAGEAIATSAPGTVHAAFGSGQRAAAQLSR